jgi:hypothetical protein
VVVVQKPFVVDELVLQRAEDNNEDRHHPVGIPSPPDVHAARSDRTRRGSARTRSGALLRAPMVSVLEAGCH